MHHSWFFQYSEHSCACGACGIADVWCSGLDHISACAPPPALSSTCAYRTAVSILCLGSVGFMNAVLYCRAAVGSRRSYPSASIASTWQGVSTFEVFLKASSIPCACFLFPEDQLPSLALSPAEINLKTPAGTRRCQNLWLSDDVTPSPCLF